MGLYSLDGIVLRARDFGEADKLVTLYTAERGKHRAVAKGARRPRSKLAGGIQPFTRSNLLCWRGRSLDGISQVQVLEGFRPLREDLERYAAATYACELLEGVTEEADAQPRLYGLLMHTLRALAEQPDLPMLDRILLSYQWKLLALIGFRPLVDRCARCGEDVGLDGVVAISLAEGGVVCRGCRPQAQAVRTVPAAVVGTIAGLIGSPLRRATQVRLTSEEAGALLGLTRDFWAYVTERQPRSGQFLEQLREAPTERGL